VDTGPLVALLEQNDIHHRSCSAALKTIAPPLITTWAVLTEAAWLLRDRPAALAKLFAGEETGVFQLASLEPNCLSEIRRLNDKYRSLRPQVADLTLLYLAERDGLETVFTLDRRDFKVFRLANGKELQLLPADL
jgi:predicted nucleic acid-binding protein